MSFPTEAISTANLIDDDKAEAARLARADLLEFCTAINALMASADGPGGATLINAGNSLIDKLANHLDANGGKINAALIIEQTAAIEITDPHADRQQALTIDDCLGILDAATERAIGSTFESRTDGLDVSFKTKANIVDQQAWTHWFRRKGEDGETGPEGPAGHDATAGGGGNGNSSDGGDDGGGGIPGGGENSDGGVGPGGDG